MDELAAWLFEQINSTTELERLDYIAEVIAFDKAIDAVYLASPQVLQILRRAWAEKKTELLDMEKATATITNVVAKTATTNDSSGQPALTACNS